MTTKQRRDEDNMYDIPDNFTPEEANNDVKTLSKLQAPATETSPENVNSSLPKKKKPKLDDHEPSSDDPSFSEHRQDDSETLWAFMYHRLLNFKGRYGHCFVHNTYGRLGRWCDDQRAHYKLFKEGKSSPMTTKKVGMLNKAGFCWTFSSRREKQWHRMYDLLVEFKESFGHCNVPKKYKPNTKLGSWVDYQRTLYRRQLNDEDSGGMNGTKDDKCKGISQERIEMLNMIGFRWSASKLQTVLHLAKEDEDQRLVSASINTHEKERIGSGGVDALAMLCSAAAWKSTDAKKQTGEYYKKVEEVHVENKVEAVVINSSERMSMGVHDATSNTPQSATEHTSASGAKREETSENIDGVNYIYQQIPERHSVQNVSQVISHPNHSFNGMVRHNFEPEPVRYSPLNNNITRKVIYVVGNDNQLVVSPPDTSQLVSRKIFVSSGAPIVQRQAQYPMRQHEARHVTMYHAPNQIRQRTTLVPANNMLPCVSNVMSNDFNNQPIYVLNSNEGASMNGKVGGGGQMVTSTIF